MTEALLLEADLNREETKINKLLGVAKNIRNEIKKEAKENCTK
jgi:hypothetical protein